MPFKCIYTNKILTKCIVISMSRFPRESRGIASWKSGFVRTFSGMNVSVSFRSGVGLCGNFV
ncbi:hypothetical protein AX27061_4652 [Achromobacter xylosoxidans NBRC 15126 = ATCC 27061]|nr:hypothetical protein AX27061_4652 [Achromobacter xylosoxidans NBRC 15126 = ATCC 27061]